MTLHPYGLVLAGILSPQGPPLGSLPAITPAPAPAAVCACVAARSDAQRLLDALNRERISSGRTPLRIDERLTMLAREHALDMATRNYFSHETPEGLSPFDRMERAAYPFAYAGENMALDQDPSAADSALWDSPGHRDNTLEPHFRRVGIAAVRTDDGELFVEDFSD